MSQDERYILTPTGYETLQQQLTGYEQRLKRQMDDVENLQNDVDEQYGEEGAAYDIHTRREYLMERIENLRLILRDAEVIHEDPNPRLIDPGDRVTVWNATEREARQYDLIGSAEVQYGREGISIESPVGKALIGQRVGDVIHVETPEGTVRYVIRSIERMSSTEL